MHEGSRTLGTFENGTLQSADQLLPLLYDELRRLAAQKLAGEKPGQTLDATALVHEAYVRLAGSAARPIWHGRGHFFAAAAEAMRRILVENARRKRRAKHGGGMVRQPLDEVEPIAPEASDDLLDLDEALHQLAAKDPLKAKLVELRCFAGLTLDEAAKVLDISPSTADRYWAYARAWLYRRLRSGGTP